MSSPDTEDLLTYLRENCDLGDLQSHDFITHGKQPGGEYLYSIVCCCNLSGDCKREDSVPVGKPMIANVVSTFDMWEVYVDCEQRQRWTACPACADLIEGVWYD